jgi:hypothetical protein
MEHIAWKAVPWMVLAWLGIYWGIGYVRQGHDAFAALMFWGAALNLVNAYRVAVDQ